MLSAKDIKQLTSKGITEYEFETQLENFEKGFPYANLAGAATVGDGIVSFTEDDAKEYAKIFDKESENLSMIKFIPASGAASRMFKDIIDLANDYDAAEDKKPFEKTIKSIQNIEKFAFYSELNAKCKRNEGREISRLLELDKHKIIVENLLTKKGLNYGFLPKGLLLFHNYTDAPRTPFEEHLVEGALYAKDSKGKIQLHFTVSNEHITYFKSLLDAKKGGYAYRFGADYDVSFSVQKPSTDTIAVDMNNEPFRTNGELLFRPGGHGALIENLNAIDADVIFVKNIDNVTLDAYKQSTIEYKSVLAGLLIKVQKKLFEYQENLDSDDVSPAYIPAACPASYMCCTAQYTGRRKDRQKWRWKA